MNKWAHVSNSNSILLLLFLFYDSGSLTTLSWNWKKKNNNNKITKRGWQFQELINQWPSECLQRTRVEIFQEKYRSYRIITVSFFTIRSSLGLWIYWGMYENKVVISNNDRESKRYCSNAVLWVSFLWQIVKTRVIRLRVIEGPNARDQIALCAFHSILVEVQTNAGYS